MVKDSKQQLENFNNDLIQYLFESREKGFEEFNKSEDFAKQQGLYKKYAEVYDEGTTSRAYNAYKYAANKAMELYPDQKDVNILDFGCGTGLIGDYLSNHGYVNIDGLDPCKEFMDVARAKGKMKNFFELRSNDDDSEIPSDRYDAVCSSGTFYTSPSHPGFECIPKICRYVKPGGRIIICTGQKYLNNVRDSENKILEDLIDQGRLEIEQKLVVENYRNPMHEVEGEKPMQGALLVFKVF